jgi:hypothetical protein
MSRPNFCPSGGSLRTVFISRHIPHARKKAIKIACGGAEVIRTRFSDPWLGLDGIGNIRHRRFMATAQFDQQIQDAADASEEAFRESKRDEMTIRLRVYNQGLNEDFIEYRNAGMLCASVEGGKIELTVFRCGQFRKTWCDSFQICENFPRGAKVEIVRFPLK